MNPQQVADPSLWQQLGQVGGVLAFVILGIWMWREKQWSDREKDWRTTNAEQWRLLSELGRTSGKDLAEVIERSTAAWIEVKTFLEARLK